MKTQKQCVQSVVKFEQNLHTVLVFPFFTLHKFMLAELIFPANIYLLKVNNKSTKTRCKICSRLAIKTPERQRQWPRSSVSITILVLGN